MGRDLLGRGYVNRDYRAASVRNAQGDTTSSARLAQCHQNEELWKSID